MSTPNKELYLKKKGEKCLYCGSIDLDSRKVTTYKGEAHQSVYCFECEQEWTDSYTLSDVVEHNLESTTARVHASNVDVTLLSEQLETVTNVADWLGNFRSNEGTEIHKHIKHLQGLQRLLGDLLESATTGA